MLSQRALQLEAALTLPVMLMQHSSPPAQSALTVQPNTAPPHVWLMPMHDRPPKPAQQLCTAESQT